MVGGDWLEAGRTDPASAATRISPMGRGTARGGWWWLGCGGGREGGRYIGGGAVVAVGPQKQREEGEGRLDCCEAQREREREREIQAPIDTVPRFGFGDPSLPRVAVSCRAALGRVI